MPVYEYTALDTHGRNVSGIIDADSAFAARQKLRTSGVFPVTVNEDRRPEEKKAKRSLFPTGRFGRLSLSELTMMTRQLSTLLSAGFPLVSALDSLISQSRSFKLKRVLSRIKDVIVEGNSFAQALSLFPGTFSPVYISMIHAGEASGTLEIVLEQLAEISEKRQVLIHRLRTALAYPIFMAFIGAAVLFLLLTYIVPSITGIFVDMNQELPSVTRFLIRLSELLQRYWWAILGGIAAGLITISSIGKTVSGRRVMDTLKLRIPLMGMLLKKLATARFARTLGSLLANGVSMMPAMEIAKNLAGNVLIANAIDTAAKDVGKGQGLGLSLAQAAVLPDLAVQMIEVGEQSGELENMLVKVADAFENEVEMQVMGLTAILEPAMILIMGVLIGFIVVSICLPIFEMNRLVV